MRKKNIILVLASFLTVSASSAFAAVEMVTDITLSNPAAMIASMAKYQATGEAENQSVTLLQHLQDGTDPSTHTIVAIFNDLGALERTMNARETSKAWADTQKTTSKFMMVNSSTLALQRKTWGTDGWRDGDFLAAVLLNVPNEAAWMKATDELMRTTKIKNPGMIRVVRLRGNAASHAVLLSSPTYEGLITYMEQMEASPEFAKASASANNEYVSTVFYRVAKIWKK